MVSPNTSPTPQNPETGASQEAAQPTQELNPSAVVLALGGITWLAVSALLSKHFGPEAAALGGTSAGIGAGWLTSRALR